MPRSVSRAGRDDPYPAYAALRQQAPVATMADGSLFVTRFADCSAVLRDPNIGHGDPAAADEWGAVPIGENTCHSCSFGPAC